MIWFKKKEKVKELHKFTFLKIYTPALAGKYSLIPFKNFEQYVNYVYDIAQGGGYIYVTDDYEYYTLIGEVALYYKLTEHDKKTYEGFKNE